MERENGEYTVEINGIFHWIKIEGKEHNTIPLVIIHGGPGGNLYTFERTIGPLLSNERTVVYYEQRGCGRSSKPISETAYSFNELIDDFQEIVEWIGSEKVDLLGYSFGGELALEITYAIPNAVNKVVLSGPSLMALKTQYMIQIAGFMSIADVPLADKIEKILGENSTIETKYNKVWGCVDIDTMDRLLFEDQSVAKMYRQLGQESNLTNTGLMLKILQENPAKIPLTNRLKDIHSTALLITGAHDRNTGIPISKIIHRNLPNCEWTLFNRSAHFPEQEEPDKFVREVLNFLKTA
ncbi:alpha/beta fold hydrolase [Bacillus sp. FJAT-22090]|uniref:alpha/beta fold hydrolase n=1 Tax=Bacillus sp. FJAT-22090 TaxID=1581038 RepID=UPI00119D0B7E|nr:alpha/beta fold hydrolase [Bacillus sp. FJAT-22090]